MNDKTAATPESLPARAPVMLPWVQRLSRLFLDITMNKGETLRYPEALSGQMFLCDADVAAVHANDACK